MRVAVPKVTRLVPAGGGAMLREHLDVTALTGGEALPHPAGTGFMVRALSDIVTMSVTAP